MQTNLSNQYQQQMWEILRNKGIICREFLLTGHCAHSSTCPYMHIRNGETRPIPSSVCTFFNRSVCLRDRCTFFHGTVAQLEELRNSGAALYRPQDFMKVASPPQTVLREEGNIIANVNQTMPPPYNVQLLQPAALQMPSDTMAYSPQYVLVPSPTPVNVNPVAAPVGAAPPLASATLAPRNVSPTIATYVPRMMPPPMAGQYPPQSLQAPQPQFITTGMQNSPVYFQLS